METDKQSHPLDGSDETKCYDIMIAERSSLLLAKKEAEQNLTKQVVTIVSGILVLVPSFLIKNDGLMDINKMALVIALSFLVVALIAGIVENYLSSSAYDEQCRIVQDFYTKKDFELKDNHKSKRVTLSINIMLIAFVAGVLSLSGVMFVAATQTEKADGRTQKPVTAAPAATPRSVAPSTAGP